MKSGDMLKFVYRPLNKPEGPIAEELYLVIKVGKNKVTTMDFLGQTEKIELSQLETAACLEMGSSEWRQEFNNFKQSAYDYQMRVLLELGQLAKAFKEVEK